MFTPEYMYSYIILPKKLAITTYVHVTLRVHYKIFVVYNVTPLSMIYLQGHFLGPILTLMIFSFLKLKNLWIKLMTDRSLMAVAKAPLPTTATTVALY